MSLADDDGVLLVAHGTVTNLVQLPRFLTEIRRGRPASPELLADMTRRYELIGGSPLLRITREQARILSEELKAPVWVGMRFGECRVSDALRAAASVRIRRLVVVPMAPFSVSLYFDHVQRALSELQSEACGPTFTLVSVPAWGEHPQLIEGFKAAIQAVVSESRAFDAPIIATAHSLPVHVIRAGDAYADQVRASASALQRALGREITLAYQSQGDAAGAWLGPTLFEQIERFSRAGVRKVIVVPIGFLTEHVETLYDLDHEANGFAAGLGLEMVRVPALNTSPELIGCLRDLVCTCTRQA